MYPVAREIFYSEHSLGPRDPAGNAYARIREKMDFATQSSLHPLLYASDTLALNYDGSLYDPELMREVMYAVQREHLAVSTVFAMHQEPVPWAQASALVEKALN